jgi:hypothetical protein
MAKYKTVRSISSGDTTLALKQRKDLGHAYFCLTWRAARARSKTNRRFYLEHKAFWEIPQDVAVHLLKRAHSEGFFGTQYTRWPTAEISVLDSKDLSQPEGLRLRDETITDNPADQRYRSDPALRIVACSEPGGVWRKVMLIRAAEGLVTFRSLTRDTEYRNAYNFGLPNGWRLDRSMLDADGSIHSAFLNALVGGTLAAGAQPGAAAERPTAALPLSSVR